MPAGGYPKPGCRVQAHSIAGCGNCALLCSAAPGYHTRQRDVERPQPSALSHNAQEQSGTDSAPNRSSTAWPPFWSIPAPSGSGSSPAAHGSSCRCRLGGCSSGLRAARSAAVASWSCALSSSPALGKSLLAAQQPGHVGPAPPPHAATDLGLSTPHSAHTGGDSRASDIHSSQEGRRVNETRCPRLASSLTVPAPGHDSARHFDSLHSNRTRHTQSLTRASCCSDARAATFEQRLLHQYSSAVFLSTAAACCQQLTSRRTASVSVIAPFSFLSPHCRARWCISHPWWRWSRCAPPGCCD